jgi:hypothetical protein
VTAKTIGLHCYCTNAIDLTAISAVYAIAHGFLRPYDSQRCSIHVTAEPVGWLRNFVEALESAAVEGDLLGSKTFLFTANYTARRAFFKDDKKSKFLFELVLCLRLLELQQGMKLHIIHCAGTQMIAQGTDGIS